MNSADTGGSHRLTARLYVSILAVSCTVKRSSRATGAITLERLEMAKNQNLTMNQIKGYLRQKGVPPAMFDTIRLALIDDAIRNSNALRTDRIFCLLALTLRKAYNFGRKRITDGMKVFDELNGRFTSPDEDVSWNELMQELRDETGLVIVTNTEDRIAFEYIGKEEIDG